METERVPCRFCGAKVLPSTVQATGGRCMPCKKKGRGISDYTVRIARPEDYIRFEKHRLVATKHLAGDAHTGFQEAQQLIDACWFEKREIILRFDSPVEMKNLVKALHRYGYRVALL